MSGLAADRRLLRPDQHVCARWRDFDAGRVRAALRRATGDAIDTTTLGWIKPELDETLRQARHEIEAYAETPSDIGRMRACAAP